MSSILTNIHSIFYTPFKRQKTIGFLKVQIQNTDLKWVNLLFLKLSFPAAIYQLKVNNRNNRTRCDTTRTTLKTSRSGNVFIVNFTHVSNLVLVVSIVNFGHVIAGWVEYFFATWTQFSSSPIDLTTFSTPLLRLLQE